MEIVHTNPTKDVDSSVQTDEDEDEDGGISRQRRPPRFSGGEPRICERCNGQVLYRTPPEAPSKVRMGCRVCKEIAALRRVRARNGQIRKCDVCAKTTSYKTPPSKRKETIYSRCKGCGSVRPLRPMASDRPEDDHNDLPTPAWSPPPNYLPVGADDVIDESDESESDNSLNRAEAASADETALDAF